MSNIAQGVHTTQDSHLMATSFLGQVVYVEVFCAHEARLHELLVEIPSP